MDMTYSDMYVFLEHDLRAQAFFNDLPGYIQDQIKARKHAPASFEELVQLAEEAKKVF